MKVELVFVHPPGMPEDGCSILYDDGFDRKIRPEGRVTFAWRKSAFLNNSGVSFEIVTPSLMRLYKSAKMLTSSLSVFQFQGRSTQRSEVR
jgi:hypothetical protein